MSAKQQTCYILTCDGCQTEFDSDETVWHWPTPGEVHDGGDDAQWYRLGDKDYCSRCRITADHEHIWEEDDTCEMCWIDQETAQS